MTQRYRRVAVAVVSATTLALAATPAYAHFCSKSGWSDAALANAPKSQAWMTADEWLGFIDEVEDAGEICVAAADNLRGQIEAYPDDTLFMGPGLLAGGTLKNGKNKTPPQFDYLDFEEAFSLCEVE